MHAMEKAHYCPLEIIESTQNNRFDAFKMQIHLSIYDDGSRTLPQCRLKQTICCFFPYEMAPIQNKWISKLKLLSSTLLLLLLCCNKNKLCGKSAIVIISWFYQLNRVALRGIQIELIPSKQWLRSYQAWERERSKAA